MKNRYLVLILFILSDCISSVLSLTTSLIITNTEIFNVTVKENTLESIEITNPPAKTEYWEGDNFEAEGMVVEAIYKKGNKCYIQRWKIIIFHE